MGYITGFYLIFILVLGLDAQIMILWSHRLELFRQSEGFIMCVGEQMIY